MLEIAAIFITVTAVLSWTNVRFVGLPTALGVIVVALLMSLVMIGFDFAGFTIVTRYAQAWISQVNFSVLLMNGMLSFLLFAGALSLDFNKLRRYRWSIGLLATIGVLVSTLAIGSAAWWLFGLFHIDVPYLYCLIFGALIAPTDPIAVLSILRKAGAPEDMEFKIVGESLFNDGVAIVIFTMLVGAASANEQLTIGHALVLVSEEAGGGILLGLALGLVTYGLMKSIDQFQVEVLLSLALVLGGYTLAIHIHVSGPIAMVSAGLFIGNRGRAYAMSEHTREQLDAFWELIDEILNAVLFVLIGLQLMVIPFRWRDVLVAVPLIAVILLTRWATIGVPLIAFRRWGAFLRGTTRVLTWGGLRGGISVALALSLPRSPYRETLILITYSIVLFSILVQGLTIGKVVAKVVSQDIPKPEHDESDVHAPPLNVTADGAPASAKREER